MTVLRGESAAGSTGRVLATIAAALAALGCSLVRPLDDYDTGRAAASYREAVLADSPLAYWRLGDDDATTAQDEVGAYNALYVDAVSTGTAGAILGDDDTAISLDGGHLTVGDAFSFADRAPFTIEVWLKPGIIDGEWRNLYSKLTAMGAGRSGHFMYVQQDDGLYQERNIDYESPGGAKESAAAPAMPAVDKWSHCVSTYDGDTMRVYLDSLAGEAGASTLELPSTTVPFLIGSGVGGVSSFIGELDEFAVYDHALSPDRVRAHYRAAGY